MLIRSQGIAERLTRCALVSFALIICFTAWRSYEAAAAGKDEPGYLVLGGNVQREWTAIGLKRLHPNRIIVISSGSMDPCLFQMFQKSRVSTDRVWLEECAGNTFENFTHGLPILRRLGVRHVTVITDRPQVERAYAVGTILGFMHGMSVDWLVCPGYDVGDRKPAAEKVALFGLACLWGVVSQIYEPGCRDVRQLKDVNMQEWYVRGFDCQQQTGVPAHPSGDTRVVE